MRKLRIAILASNFIRIPPLPMAKYVPKGFSGAPEMIIYEIAEGMVRKGHEVTVFASGDSEVSAKLISVTDEATWKNVGVGRHKDYEHLLISKAYQMAEAGEFDIIHSNYDVRSAYYAPLVKIPTVSTLHSPLDDATKKKDILKYYFNTQYYVSISDNQRKDLPELQYIGTVYNGIDIKNIPFKEEKEDFLIFVGRIVETKGVSEAIEIAKKTNHKLHIFGTPEEKSDYWDKKIKPYIDNKQIFHHGAVAREELFDYISRAKAFIFPLQWEEPFGLVSIEAMATGTPTIALSKGALPEVIEDKKTGFLCKSLDEMIEALNKLNTIKPFDCRKRVENMFTIEKMVDNYEKLYFKILNKN
ncbi:MAG: glycosyltransferase family 4 protein [bacterium]